MKKVLTLMLSAALVFGCGNDETTDESTAAGQLPTGGKFDTPAGTERPEDFCAKRRAEAIEGANKHFIDGFIRWPVADVEGVNTVNQDDRGQEYTEYFVIVQLPPETEDGEKPAPVFLGHNQEDEEGEFSGVSDLGVRLSEDQEFYLEDNGDEVVGQCMFTSWHQDTPGPLPICNGDDANCPSYWGMPLTTKNIRMKVSFNSNSAAGLLVQDCVDTFDRDEIIPPTDNPDSPLWDDFFRGCMLAHYTYQTEWRSSDTAVCAAALRLAECGCSLPGDLAPGVGLVPPQPVTDEEGNESITLRGFKLAGWDDPRELPPGCRYVDTGEDMQALVACDLTGTDLLRNPDDPKETCRSKYGINVVVHVPVPGHLVSCAPEEGGLHTQTCNEKPWWIGWVPPVVEEPPVEETGAETETGDDPATGDDPPDDSGGDTTGDDPGTGEDPADGSHDGEAGDTTGGGDDPTPDPGTGDGDGGSGE